LLLTVADQGKGIPADKQARIFEPFFTTRQQGTGLGLALVKKVVEAHGGTIRVESGADQGTTFVIELPSGREEGSRHGQHPDH
jgi:signal transduction histidine kinase